MVILFLWKLKLTYNGIYLVINVLVAQLCLSLCDPMDCSLSGSSVHEIFLTQGWNLGHLHWGQILYSLSHQGSPFVVSANANKSLLGKKKKKEKNYYLFWYQLILHKVNVELMQLYKPEFSCKTVSLFRSIFHFLSKITRLIIFIIVLPFFSNICNILHVSACFNNLIPLT